MITIYDVGNAGGRRPGGRSAYMSPQQTRGRPATEASDRYALAVAAFELLVGELPFQAEHFAALAVPALTLGALLGVGQGGASARPAKRASRSAALTLPEPRSAPNRQSPGRDLGSRRRGPPPSPRRPSPT